MKSVKHSRLSQRIEEAITDPAKCQVSRIMLTWRIMVKLQAPGTGASNTYRQGLP